MVVATSELTIVRGQGAEVWDEAGRRYIDCVAGQGSAVRVRDRSADGFHTNHATQSRSAVQPRATGAHISDAHGRDDR